MSRSNIPDYFSYLGQDRRGSSKIPARRLDQPMDISSCSRVGELACRMGQCVDRLVHCVDHIACDDDITLDYPALVD